MAKITDPDLLVRSSSSGQLGTDGNIWIDTTAKTISLAAFGSLEDDSFADGGVQIQTLYSYLKEEWKTDSALIMYPFPMVPIHPEQFEFVEGWTPLDASTIELFRDAGFAITASGVSEEEYICVIGLGDVDGGQVYYTQAGGNTPTATDFALTDAVNQCVKVYGDGSHGDFDYRDYFSMFTREQAKTYDNSTHDDIGVSTFTYQAYRFPLSNSDDLKVTHDDTAADAYGVTVEYFAVDRQRDIGGVDYDFDIIIDGNDRTAEEIYEAIQSALRKATDIDDGIGTVNGKTASDLLTFVGDTLVTSTGVFIDNFQATDTNRLEFYDVTGTKRTFPYVAAGSITFNSNLVDDSGAIYRMFFTDANGNDFGDSDAILVDDNGGTDISGDIVGSEITFDFDYDANVQGGRTAGTDADVTVVCIGLDKAQYVVATGTITRSTSNSISIVSALERNYVNP